MIRKIILPLLLLALSSPALAQNQPLDTTTFLVVGGGLSAGYSGFQLIAKYQQESYPVFMARQMGAAFPLPLFDPIAPAQSGAPAPLPIFHEGDRVSLVSFNPLANLMPSVSQSVLRILPFPLFTFDVSVPFIKVSETLNTRPALPFVREGDLKQTMINEILGYPAMVLDSPPSWSQIEYTEMMEPTFIVLELGFGDVIDGALSGDPSKITPAGSFATDYDTIAARLKNTFANVLVLNVPDPTNTAHFTMSYDGSGTSDGIVFPGGQTYDLLDNRVFNNPLFASEGDLDLKTGKIANFSVRSIFQNSTIARVTKNIRIPFGFVSDYPPTDLPIGRPFTDKPPVSTTASFHFDSYGNITGFEFAGFSVAPVTLFPRLGIFPPFSFGENGNFYFANPNGCVANAPPQNCLNDQNNPNGILLAANGFFHPHFNLYTDELVEAPASTVAPPCQLKGIASGNGLVAVNGKLYQVGGFDGSDASAMVQAYDPAVNQWGAAAPMGTPVMAAQSVAIGSRIYVVGGFLPGIGKSANLVQVFDPATNSWSVRNPAILVVSGAAAAQVNGKCT